MKLYRQGMAVDYHLATPADIIAAFNDLPDAARLRAFLLAMADIAVRHEWVSVLYDPVGLSHLADRLEREDAEKAREAAEVEDVAREIARGMSETGVYSESSLLLEKSRKLAGTLYAKGYRKQADDD